MSRVLVVAMALLAAGCGGSGGDPSTPSPRGAPPSGTPETPTVSRTQGTAQSEGDPLPSHQLSGAERRRVASIASRLERAIERFDRMVVHCDGNSRRACIDRAWAVIVVEAEWPLYYLVRMTPNARGCGDLALATAHLDGFNLAGRQLDYGPPGEDSAARSNDLLALVDTLRPVPDEFRAAAADECRV
jgi:hypothetical protein